MEFEANVSQGQGLKSIDFRVIESPSDDSGSSNVLNELQAKVTEIKAQAARRLAVGLPTNE